MSKPSKNLSIEVPLDLMKELLTDSEWRMIKQRLYIAQLLKQGLTIRAIAEKAKVGTDTVVRVSKKLEESPLLRQTLSELTSPQTKSKWIFGQSKNGE